MSNRPDLYEITTKNHKEYCEKHGYTYTFYDELFDTSRHPSWSKVLVLLKTAIQTDCPYILWVDDDTLFTDMNKSLDSFIETYQFDTLPAVVMIAEDICRISTFFNCGVMLFKKHPSTLHLLETVWNLGNVYSPTHFSCGYEQEVFNFYYKFCVREHILRVPLRSLQSMYRTADKDTSVKWNPGDFLCHFCGGSVEERISLIQSVQKQLK